MTRTAMWFLGLTLLGLGPGAAAEAVTTLLHASFDLSRELCLEINRDFSIEYRKESGRSIRIYQSHAGSAKQARAVLEGLPADVLTLNVPLDFDLLSERSDLVAPNWRTRFPWNSSPCSSTVVFLVRSGNPLLIKDWPDLVGTGRKLIVPHPKTSGNGRYGYLAALAFAHAAPGADPASERAFLKDLYRNVPILEGGGRSATLTFIQRNIGDALITLEAEALQVMNEHPGQFLLIRPSCSIEVNVVAALVEPVIRRRKSRELAERYLGYFFTLEGQETLSRHYYRPRLAQVAKEHSDSFPKMNKVTVEELCGSWDQAQKEHFAEGALFDRIMASLH